MKYRYIFEVDYENDQEWGLGVAGREPGERVSKHELADVLRKVANRIESFPDDPPPVKYPVAEGET